METGESESKEKEDRNKREVRQSACESNGIAHVEPKKVKKRAKLSDDGMCHSLELSHGRCICMPRNFTSLPQ